MTPDRLATQSEKLDARTVRFAITDSEGPLSWRRMLACWREESALADVLGRALADLPFAAFRWETPAMVSSRLDSPFECVAVDDPSLGVRPDPAPFAEHLSPDQSVVRFPNLGGDALMVVPCRQCREFAYSHIGAFVRRAPREQQRALWREVSLAMDERLGERPVWLSTAGTGVAWLHVRLDDRPKYYLHSPYRESPAQAG